jgi:hypothetical protein
MCFINQKSLRKAYSTCPGVLFTLLPFFWLCSSTALAQADPSERAAIEIVSIQHRDPAQIRQQISPVLDPRGSIGQIDNKLVIATTATNLSTLKSLIDQADTPRRRLVVSVDFDHNTSNPFTNVSRQQSSQAIEGDELQVIDNPGFGEARANVQLMAEVQGQLAQVNFQLNNVPGFVGRHQVQIPLGAWFVINPDGDDDMPGGTTDSGEILLPTQPQRVVALRVDVLP